MASSKLKVGVLGAGAWAQHAHIPGWQRDPRCEIVAICDVKAELARDFARQFNIPEATDDWQALVERSDIDVIDSTLYARVSSPWLSSMNAGYRRGRSSRITTISW